MEQLTVRAFMFIGHVKNQKKINYTQPKFTEEVKKYYTKNNITEEA